MKRVRFAIWTGMSLLLVAACAGAGKTDGPNRAGMYKSQQADRQPKTHLYHHAPDASTLYIKMPDVVLPLDSAGFEAFRLQGEIHRAGDTAQMPPDSLDQTFRFSKDRPHRVVQMELPLANGADYNLNFRIANTLGKTIYAGQLKIRKNNTHNEQNYLLADAKNYKLPVFETYAKTGTALTATHRGEAAKLEVRYFKPDGKPALPPFVTGKTRPLPSQPDSSFLLPEGESLQLAKTGLYILRRQGDTEGGKAIVCVDGGFPKLTAANDLVDALRFITRNEEYRQLSGAKNAKAAVDSFWMQRAGNFDRGRVLVKEFYGRVQRANLLFTDYQEGWKTDRGLAFIIYGEPDEVYQSPDVEKWYYKATAEREKLSFTFLRQPLPYLLRHYAMQRDPQYEQSWHKAVYEWRKGIIKNGSQ